jgi:hypothetical protein
MATHTPKGSMPLAEANPKQGDGEPVWIVNHYAAAPDRPAGRRHFDLARRRATRPRSARPASPTRPAARSDWRPVASTGASGSMASCSSG